MQKYKPKTPLASVGDRLLRALLTAGLGVGWFVWLWGLSLPALTAGVAMGGLMWLCARSFGKKSVEKREKQMRRIIGGELALRRLLLMGPRHAAFQAALWIAPVCPVCMRQAVEWGVLGTLDGQETYVRLIARHESQPVGVDLFLDAAREAAAHRARRVVVCLTAPAPREALTWAAEAEPPIRVVDRETLIELAGLQNPATDDDLRALGRRKRARRPLRDWLRMATDDSRASRYFWYGMGLSGLALLTGQPYHSLPALACLGLFGACKWRAYRSR